MKNVNVNIIGALRITTPKSPWPVYEITSPHAMIQLAGYFKFLAPADSMVLFRGDTKLRSSCRPTAMRNMNSLSALTNFGTKMRSYIDLLMESPCTCVKTIPGTLRRPWNCSEIVKKHTSASGNGLVAGTPRIAVEPILQHYGLDTRWIDVVDNIWIALWFACHSYKSTTQGSSGKFSYAHHMKRSEFQEPGGFAYISLISTGSIQRDRVAGLWIGNTTRLIDLRSAAPSVYVRPHAQHGLLITSASWKSPADFDLATAHLATFKVRLGDALDWLGDGTMLRPFVLFPPATTDEGYRRLLDFAPSPPTRLGRFAVYGPGN